jgi:hypothetical protein
MIAAPEELINLFIICLINVIIVLASHPRFFTEYFPVAHRTPSIAGYSSSSHDALLPDLPSLQREDHPRRRLDPPACAGAKGDRYGFFADGANKSVNLPLILTLREVVRCPRGHSS